MATFIPYTPTGVIAKALFNFDETAGIANFIVTGTVIVSVSDSFTFDQYLGSVPRISSDIYTSLGSGDGGWTAVQLANIDLITSTYSNFVNLSFSAAANESGHSPAAVGSASDINISAIYRTDLRFSGESALGTDANFGYAGSRGDVVLNIDGFGFSGLSNDFSLNPTSFGFHVLMHEIGHSLGLSHPHSSVTNGVPVITADYAATTGVGFDKLGFHSNSPNDLNKEYFSIMSYDDQTPAGAPDTFAQTPMILDVIALQAAYGEGGGSSGTGNDAITPGGGGAVSSFRTYFDTGGVDTIDLVNYASGAYLHMGTAIVGAAHLVSVSMSIDDAHTMTDLGGDPSSLRWFYGEYENAIGSAGNDVIVGNIEDNLIDGGAGSDSLSGGGGNDTFRYASTINNGIDTIGDLSHGDAILLDGTSLVAAAVSAGDGSSVAAGRVHLSSASSQSVLYIGLDTTPGADLVIQLTGPFQANQFTAVGNEILADAAPTLANAIADQAATEDSAFSFAVPTDAFADTDIGDTLSYRATRADGSALPAWIAFNASTRTFSGTPANADVGSLGISVTATDGLNLSASDSFTITIANSNDAPTLVSALADRIAIKDTAFSYIVPAGTFADVDVGDSLSYSASLASGADLPGWLAFDAGTRTFSGTPGASDTGTIDVKLTATDTSNASAADVFALTVPGDTRYTLSGNAYFWNAVAAQGSNAAGHVLMDGVSVSVDDGGIARGGTTAAGGAYAVTGIASTIAAVTASQSPSAADKATVTLGDALEVLKLFLGKVSSPSPYQYLASDFNADNKVTLTDALEILKSVLNKAGAVEPAWLFVDEEANLSALSKDNATQPTLDAHPVATDPSLNLAAMLRGDANGSWKPAATASYEVLPDSYFTDASTGLVGLHPDHITAAQFGL